MTAPTRPVLRWHGGKWKLAPWILQHMPPHRVYVEPFGGGASILLRKRRSISEVYNDLDAELVNFFRICRNQPAKLAAALALTPYARDEYRDLYAPARGRIERARRFVARSFMGQNSKGAFARSGFDARINDDDYLSRLTSLVALPDVVMEVAARLTDVLIENCDGSLLLDRYDGAGTLFYIDPPYLQRTRSRTRFPKDMTEVQHSDLLARLLAVEGMVMLSAYPDALYDAALAGWRRLETKTMADGSHARTEVLWLNPACAAALDRHRLPLLAGLPS